MAVCSATAAAFETLRLATGPSVVMRARLSYVLRVSSRKPLPSEPITSAVGCDQSMSSMLCSAAPSSPTIVQPDDFYSSNARDRLATSATGTSSSAPDADLARTPFNGGLCRRVITRPLAPNTADDLNMAPTLCGSVT